MDTCILRQELREEFDSVTSRTIVGIKDSLKDTKSPLRRALAKHFETYKGLLEPLSSEKEYM